MKSGFYSNSSLNDNLMSEFKKTLNMQAIKTQQRPPSSPKLKFSLAVFTVLSQLSEVSMTVLPSSQNMCYSNFSRNQTHLTLTKFIKKTLILWCTISIIRLIVV